MRRGRYARAEGLAAAILERAGAIPDSLATDKENENAAEEDHGYVPLVAQAGLR
jgi:hypothetical protein